MNIAVVIVLGLIIAGILGTLLLSLMAYDSAYEDVLGQHRGPLSRYLGLPKGVSCYYGNIDLPINEWQPDGANGFTLSTVGTNAQFLSDAMQFNFETADDIGYTKFTIPPDFNYEDQEIYLALKWYSADHDDEHYATWDGVVRRVPEGVSNSDDNEVWDAAGDVALTAVNALADDTTLEVVTTFIDLAVTDYSHGDDVQLTLLNDVSENTLTAVAYVVSANIVYAR